jgi:hypothetical protein
MPGTSKESMASPRPVHPRGDRLEVGASGPAVDVTRLLAGLRRSPRERLDHAVQVARVTQRFRKARSLGPLLPR